MHTLNAYFDKVFCINLDRRRGDRWVACKAEFEKHGIAVERISAVDGRDIPDNGPVRGGSRACLLSHRAILKRIVDSQMERVLILEDDVEFRPDLGVYFDQVWGLLPESWDMLYLGGNHVAPPKAVNEAVARITKTATASQYAVTRAMAKRALRATDWVYGQIDVVYSTLHEGSEAFTFHPPLAWQRPGWSDIQGAMVDYKCMRPAAPVAKTG